MKKLAFAVLLAAAVFALSQCELFSTNVQYNIIGSSSNLDILYQDENGQLIEMIGPNPGIISFQVFGSELPFLAFISVTNSDFINDVNVFILEDGIAVVGPSTAGKLGGSTEIYWIVD